MLPANYAVQGPCITVGCLSVRPSVRLTVPSIHSSSDVRLAVGLLLSPGACSRHRPTAAGAQAAAAGSVTLRAEVRGSTQTCSL